MIWLRIDKNSIDELPEEEDYKSLPDEVYIRPEDAEGWCIEGVRRAYVEQMQRIWSDLPYFRKRE